MTHLRTTSIVLGAALALGACSASGQSSPATATKRFSTHVTNAWFPLKPGSVYRYRGTKDGHKGVDVLRVTHRTKTIQGARCVVIDDRTYLAGRLREKTFDYYSQDRKGNVWYFGEDTASLRADGSVESREGTWRAGRHGARAGIYITAHPRVGQTRRQEYYKGHAEDTFTVRKVTKNRVRTTEQTRLEPGVVDEKVYKRGVGVVLENQLKGPGPKERFVLVSFRKG